MYKNKPSKKIISSTLIGTFTFLIIGFIFSHIFSNSCKYHEPINKEIGKTFNMFFNLVSGHPEANRYYWLLMLFFGIVSGFFIRKKCRNVF